MGGTMKAGDYLAAYGHFRAGLEGHTRLPFLEGRLRHAGPCLIRGVLIDLGAYPGLLAGEGEVIGDLFEILDPTVEGPLDAYEDYDPADERPFDPAAGTGSRYLRRRIDLISPKSMTAWVYVWNVPSAPGTPIASGDWAGHLTTRD